MPIQTSDGTQIPAAGVTNQYIQDVNAGLIYVVTTTVTVQQMSLSDLETQLSNAQAAAAAAQSLVEQLTPAATSFQVALNAPVIVSPAQPMQVNDATSTPQ